MTVGEYPAETLPAQSRESDLHCREILQNLTDSICLLEVLADGRFRYLEANSAFENLMGVPAGGMPGRYFGDLSYSLGIHTSATAYLLIDQFKQCLASGEAIEMEANLDLPVGRRRFRVTLTPLRQQSGAIGRILVVGVDISASKQAEQQIDFMSFALNQLHEAVLMMDARLNYQFIYVNDKACQLLGYTRQELLHKSLVDFDLHINLALAGEAGSVDAPYVSFDSWLRRKDGHVFPVNISRSSLAYENKLMCLCLLRDMTVQNGLEVERILHFSYFENMSRINRAIQGVNDLDSMLANLLEIVVTLFNCDRTFLIYSGEQSGQAWRRPREDCKAAFPKVFNGDDAADISQAVIRALNVVLSQNDALQFGVLTGHPLPKVLSVEFGCQSGLAIAIYPRGDLPWIFGILQCVEARDWMLNEEKLMLEIGKRLGSELSILLAYRDVKEREMEFRTLAETLPDNITRFDREARIIYANPTLSRTLGKSAAEMRGKTPKQLYPEGSCDAYQDNIELVIRAGRAVEMEMPFPNLRGGIDYFQVAIVPERGQEGDIIGALSLAHNYTKIRQLTIELARRESEFRALAENSPDIIIRYNRECQRIYVNQAYRKLFGPASLLVLGATPLESWHFGLPDAQLYMETLQRVIQTKTPETFEMERVDDQGNPSYFAMYLVPELDDRQTVMSVLSISRDITEGKTIEQKREAAREEERKLIAQELHDELGQRLTALRMDLYRLQQRVGEYQPELRVQIQEMAAAVDGNIQVLRGVVTTLRPAVLDMGIVLALESLAEVFQKRTGIRCRLRLSTQPLDMEDKKATMVYRIVQESLTNIARHAEADYVSVKLEQDLSAFMLEITDNGVGFDPKVKPASGSYGLIGIRERVQMLGGRLSLKSGLGKGVKLGVRFPKNAQA